MDREEEEDWLFITTKWHGFPMTIMAYSTPRQPTIRIKAQPDLGPDVEPLAYVLYTSSKHCFGMSVHSITLSELLAHMSNGTKIIF